MKLFYTPSSKHLADLIDCEKGSCTIKQFSDGEWHVTIHDEVENTDVWVLSETGAPADHILQLLLLCDALKHAGAQLNLFITYFGYARQDKPLKGEAHAAELMCQLLEKFNPHRIEVIHLHNPNIGIQEGGPRIRSHIPYHFFYKCMTDTDVIVAPDKGAVLFATHIAEHTSTPLAICEKYRPEPEQVTMQLIGDVVGKRVLIVDDMITTGRTIIRAAELVYEKGAHSVIVAATHGVFADDALSRLEESGIKKVYVTNTLTQEYTTEKLSVINIAPFIQKIILG